VGPMRLLWDWLHPVIQVPYVPTIGPVHPDALTPGLFDDVLRVAGSGMFLPYDKDQRWTTTKDETVLPEHIEHTQPAVTHSSSRPQPTASVTTHATI
jgi:hypothetical protein